MCISGDIGWKGNAADYRLAGEWLTELLRVLNLAADRVFLCAGNHDIDRGVSKGYARPAQAPEADEILSVPIRDYLGRAFQAFGEFAKGIGIPPYRLGATESWLVGQRSVAGLSVVAVNSAWFCKDDTDKGKLWIGRRQIDTLECHNQLPHPDQIATWCPTAVLIHHPNECLHEDEIHSTGNRPATFRFLAKRCHLMLSGHAHPRPQEADMVAETAWHLNGSATYADELYSNGFSLIQVDPDGFVYRSFEYDSASPAREWRQTLGPKYLSRAGAIVTHVPTPALPDLEAYRTASLSNARGLVEAKSRALKPWGELPAIQPIQVRLQVQGVRPRFQTGELLEHESNVQTVSLFEATRSSRRTLLLGDLGSGKSTTAANYVVQAIHATPNSLALFLPAAALITARQSTGWATVRDFLGAVSAYFDGQISPEGPSLDVEALLKARVELAMVVDGLDEVHPDQARSILHHLAEVVDHWANSQVLATGRPVELLGVNYSRWQICTTAPLTDDEKFSFFAAEAVADGDNEHGAHAAASAALQTLRGLAEIHSLAVTPLFCRLLFRRLRLYRSGAALTLGDLLYELVRERVADWSKRDSKSSPTATFDALYPDADSRAAVLAEVALELYPRRLEPVEEVRRQLETLLAQSGTANVPALIEEGLRAFERSGLVTMEGGFQFTLQPFAEFLCGYGRALRSRHGLDETMPSALEQWRVASFTATAARRLGLTDRFRSEVTHFVSRVLREVQNVPAASHIVCEFQDPVVASGYIDELESLGRRPLWFSVRSHDAELTARAIAEALRLAGDKGFNWFFAEYLDPRYPYVHAGSAVSDMIFREWAKLAIGSLSKSQRERLFSLVAPHVAAGSHQLASFIPYLAVLVPEAFEEDQRLWFCAGLLNIEPFRGPAEAQFSAAITMQRGEKVDSLLTGASQIGYEYSFAAASLHLSLFPGRPPLPVMRAIIRPGYGPDRSAQKLAILVDRLGDACTRRFLHWFLSDPDQKAATGAAIALYQRGERRLALLGRPLMLGLHDGGYVAKAEEVLNVIVKREGEPAVRWLASTIGNDHSGIPRSHSGWWRVFLGNLSVVGGDGPNLLVKSLPGVGEFLLARHPEIRQSLRDLLSGANGPAFKRALRDCLRHSDPERRHGAAMVLTACCPNEESQAVEEAVRCKSRQRYGGWHEWEQFCLTLEFGPSVVAHLKSQLGTFPSDSEVFALAILFRNGATLESDQLWRLVHGELSFVLAPDDARQVCESAAGIPVLLRMIQTASPEVARGAADILLRRHADKLSDEQRAMCTALAIGEVPWNRRELDGEMRRMDQNPRYAELITRCAGELVDRGFPAPLLDLIYRARTDEAVWERIVWRELCTGDLRVSFNTDEHGQWILDFMRQFPEYAAAIGRAARKFVSDPRLQVPGVGDAIDWLALLAHEGGALGSDEIEQIFVRRAPIQPAAFVALIARLQSVPTGLRRRQSVGMPAFVPRPRTPLPGSAINALHECARPSESLHPSVCATIENSFFEGELQESGLKSLAEASKNGSIIACTLAFAYNITPGPDWVLRVFGYRPPPVPQDHCLPRLRAIWGLTRSLASDNAEWLTAYTNALSEGLCSGSGDVLAFASELLERRGSLTPPESAVCIEAFTRDVHPQDGLTARLVSWLSGALPTDVLAAIRNAVEGGLSELDAQPWTSGGGHVRDAGPFLLLPLLHWKITGESDDRSKRVFLRGLRMSVVPEPPLGSRRGAIEEVYPLLSIVPRSFLQEAIRHGETVQDPETRALCALFLAVSPSPAE